MFVGEMPIISWYLLAPTYYLSLINYHHHLARDHHPKIAATRKKTWTCSQPPVTTIIFVGFHLTFPGFVSQHDHWVLLLHGRQVLVQSLDRKKLDFTDSAINKFGAYYELAISPAKNSVFHFYSIGVLALCDFSSKKGELTMPEFCKNSRDRTNIFEDRQQTYRTQPKMRKYSFDHAMAYGQTTSGPWPIALSDWRFGGCTRWYSCYNLKLYRAWHLFYQFKQQEARGSNMIKLSTAPRDPSDHLEVLNVMQTSDHKGGLGRLPHRHLEKNTVIWDIWWA